MSKINPHIHGLISDTWDGFDLWGSALETHFAIAELLHFEGGGCPAEWEYRPGCTTGPVMVAYDPEEPDEGDESFSLQMLIDAWLAGYIDAGDLLYAGNVLHRYERLLVLAGKDY